MRRLRTQLGKIRLAISEKKVDEVERLLSPTLALIDSSTHHSLLHRNKAARQKSRLMSQINSLSGSASSA
jgi:ribosomal protein S20